MKAVFLDRGSFPAELNVQYPAGITEVVEYASTEPAEVSARIQDANIVLTNKVILDAESLHSASHLNLVQVMATGTNNVDTATCKTLSIAVQNVSGYSTVSVPEHTFSLLLALRRNLFSYLNDVRNGKWSTSKYFCFLDYPIQDLAGSCMAIIGKGVLGQRVADIATAFGIKPIYAERKHASSIREGYVEFKSALKMADIVTLHCPLTEETHHMISYGEFQLMKPNSILINTGRGGLVDEAALTHAIEHQRIAGAGFDVSSIEPMPIDHPLQKLTFYPNFLLTPHVAWASAEAMQKLIDIAMDNIGRFINE